MLLKLVVLIMFILFLLFSILGRNGVRCDLIVYGFMFGLLLLCGM